MKKSFVIFLLCIVSLSLYSQKKKDILITIGDEPVLVEEFKRVYVKNIDLVQDDSQKNIDSYLDLFIDYKLKVKEAYIQNLDQTEEYQKEFSKYQEQLSRNYLFEDNVTSKLIKEAYDRGLIEINADHILIVSRFDDLPQDTLTAYNKLKVLRERALAGEDFTKLVKENSEEPGAKEREGKLGYFSAFAMVYPFENEAYNTPTGEISNIVRTQFGFHILKINGRRPKEHKINASHIMISNRVEGRNYEPEDRIREIYAKLQQGEAYENLAKQYSDDSNSAKNGGNLRPFGKGDLRSTKFEDEAYKLEKVGDISEPIETTFGWHIIKLDEIFGLPSFEEEKEFIEKRVKTSERAKIVTQKINQKIIDKYGFSEGEEYLSFFTSFIGDEILTKKWVFKAVPENDNKLLFAIGKRNVTFNDFAKFFVKRQASSKPYKVKESLIKDYFNDYKEQEIKQYFKDELEVENKEYAAVINEYRSGLLIYDVMNKNIWEKSKKDTLGLRSFYDANKENYKWKERVEAVIVSASDEETAKKAEELLEKNVSEKEIKETLNIDKKVQVIITSGTFEKGQRELPENFETKKGVSKIYTNNGSFIVVKVTNILMPTIKLLEEVKGKVMSNYQTYLEINWMKELRNKNEIIINKKALKKVKKQLNN
ncbi:MAG: peptidyl-prolyl cis-trans isomerase SurA [Flavobacteriaceae bacterium]|jgi:peptidyl-prolyl cis-trans isomerase SurA|uniref:peptidylprolyl isomerase n=1 Tax=Candidatus Marifrigoribacter sp. Uisw_064 TaxID=3230970 RepID=UPI003AE883A9